MSKREEFASLVEDLITQFERDLQDADWVTKRFSKKMRDSDRTVYEVPFLVLQRGPVQLSLDPTAYDIPGADAAVDLYLMPAFDPLATFYSDNGRWMIHSDFLPKPTSEVAVDEGRESPLSRDVLKQVLGAIAEDAIPSV